MAIELEFIDFIVPIATIKQKYPGGWEQCLKDHDYQIGRCVWYDEHLFRTGAMGAEGIKSLVDEWQSKGFHTYDEDEEGNLTKWVDVCVYERFFGGETLPCDWIAFDDVTCGVYLKGTVAGKLVTRNDFVPTDKIPDWIFE